MSVPVRQKAYQALGDLEIEFPAWPREVNGLPALARPGHRRSRTVEFTYRRGRPTAARCSPATRRTRSWCGSRPASRGALKVSAEADQPTPGQRWRPIPSPARWPDSAIRFEAQYCRRPHGTRTARTLILDRPPPISRTTRTCRPTRARGSGDAGGGRAARAMTRSAPSTSPIIRRSSAASRSTWALAGGEAADRRTHRRLRRRAAIPSLVALLFQFGRYLMIGSSRPGGQPANLQGLWNESNTPAWDSKYTDNINTEMNYWPVGGGQPLRMPPAAVRCAEGPGRGRRDHREGALQRARLGAAPQLRPVARHGAHQRHRTTASGRPAAPGSRRTCGSTTCSPATSSSCATPPIR